MRQRKSVQREGATEPSTWRLRGEEGSGALIVGGAFIVALLGLALVAFDALPMAALLIASVPLALVSTKFVKRGRPRGTA